LGRSEAVARKQSRAASWLRAMEAGRLDLRVANDAHERDHHFRLHYLSSAPFHRSDAVYQSHRPEFCRVHRSPKTPRHFQDDGGRFRKYLGIRILCDWNRAPLPALESWGQQYVPIARLEKPGV